MIHKLLLIKITEKSGATKEFIAGDLNGKLCHRFENGAWFEDEIWYLEGQAQDAEAKVQYARISLDTSTAKFCDLIQELPE